MIFATYHRWRNSIIAEFEALHEKQECQHCEGFGTSTCHCCGNKTDCDECSGDGCAWFTLEGEQVEAPNTTAKAYRKAVLRDLVAMQRMTGRSYYKQAREFLNGYFKGVTPI